MSDENSGEFQPKSLADQAVSLIVDFDADASDDNLATLKAWYQRSADHQQAFASAMFATDMAADVRHRIEASFGRKFEIMPQLPGTDAGARPRLLSAPHLQPWGPRRSANEIPARGRGRGRGRERKRALIGATAVAAIAIVVVVVSGSPTPIFNPIGIPATAQTFKTGHAEIRSFSLSDGSDITLDSDTRVEVTIDRAHRHAQLHQGRARFVVKADPRPFTIEAANGKIVASQGTIDVEVDGTHGADIRLRSGAASVQTGDSAAKVLETGRPVILGPTSVVPTVVASPVVDTRDWPTGWVEYRAISLDALIAQANQYARIPIILDDPSLGTLQASGRFRLTDTEKFAARIAEPFGLKVSRRTDGIHLSR